jgi:two-component sensor histidine kinase
LALSQLFDLKQKDAKTVLLYRFHIVAIVVNILAIFIDSYLQRYTNALIEGTVVVFLLLSLWYLYRFDKVKISAYLFIFSISTALFTLIYINHFATMSVVFILLLPLTTLIFLTLKESLFLTLLYFILIASLLYLEHINNPTNPLAHNFQALFNLAYTAIIVYIFGLLYHFTILRTFKELDDSNQQKVLLLREVHHRVKNNLNMIAAIIGLHSNTLEGKEQEEMLKTQNRISSIAIVHEMLYKHDNFAQINFERYMKQLSTLILSTYASNKKIHINIKSNTEYMPLEIMVQLGIMVNEFITNSIKYAFPQNSGQIDISLTQTEESYLFIYRDNGIGYEAPEDLLKHKSLGIKLINLTAKQLKGNVVTSSPNGLKFEVRF